MGRPVRRARRPQPPALDRPLPPADLGRARGSRSASRWKGPRLDRRGTRSPTTSSTRPSDFGACHSWACGLQLRGVTVGGGVQICSAHAGHRSGLRSVRRTSRAAGRCRRARRAGRRSAPGSCPCGASRTAGPRAGLRSDRGGRRARSGSGRLRRTARRTGRRPHRGRGVVRGPVLGAGRVLDGVDDAVEHHRPHPLREQVGVGLAEHGAVGQADVGELLLARELSQASRSRAVSAVEMCDSSWPITSPHRCGRSTIFSWIGRRLLVGVRDGHVLPERRLLGVARRSSASASCRACPGDPTTRCRTGRRPTPTAPGRCSSDEIDAALAGTAGVEEHRPDALVGLGGRVADDGQLDLLAGRVGPVQRHRDLGALEPGIAGGPVDPGPGSGAGRRRR